MCGFDYLWAGRAVIETTVEMMMAWKGERGVHTHLVLASGCM
jgi:hypothetical protein